MYEISSKFAIKTLEWRQVNAGWTRIIKWPPLIFSFPQSIQDHCQIWHIFFKKLKHLKTFAQLGKDPERSVDKNYGELHKFW